MYCAFFFFFVGFLVRTGCIAGAMDDEKISYELPPFGPSRVLTVSLGNKKAASLPKTARKNSFSTLNLLFFFY